MTNVDSQTVRSLSVFSGVGGLDLALHRACPRVEPVLFCEREFAAARILRARAREGWFGPAGARAGIWSDVRTIPEWVRADLVVGGFPCQDISTAGRGDGIHGERSGLWFDMLDAAVRVGARYLVLENVAAITSRGLDAVLGSLAEVGFDAEWTMLRASDVGAPHQRARWFCLAWRRRDVGETDQPRSQGRSVRGRGRADERAARPGGGAVADADSGRSPERGAGQPTGREEPKPRKRGQQVADAGIDGQLGGAERDSGARAGCEGREQRAHPDGHALAGLPAWPPAPNDAEGWAYVLERWPELAPALADAEGRRGRERQPGPRTEQRALTGGTGSDRRGGETPKPALRGLADGTPPALDVPRVDQLRALGNAVVPAQAEAAIRHLIGRAPAWVQAELL